MNRNDRIVALTRELFTDDHIVRLAEVFGQTPDKVAEMLQRSNTYGSRDVFLLRVLKLVQEHGLMDEALAAIQDEKDLLKASLRQSRPTVGREKEIADRMAARRSQGSHRPRHWVFHRGCLPRLLSPRAPRDTCPYGLRRAFRATFAARDQPREVDHVRHHPL